MTAPVYDTRTDRWGMKKMDVRNEIGADGVRLGEMQEELDGTMKAEVASADVTAANWTSLQTKTLTLSPATPLGEAIITVWEDVSGTYTEKKDYEVKQTSTTEVTVKFPDARYPGGVADSKIFVLG